MCARIDTHARKRYTLTRYYIKSQNKDLLNSLSLSLSLSAHHHQAHTLYTRARLKNERGIPRTVRSFMSSRSAKEEEGRRRRRRERHVYDHQLTILAQHAYALSLGATVLKEEEEEELELKPVQRRTYVAVPEERIATRFDIVLQACDWTKRRRKERMQEVCDVRDVSRGDVFVVVRVTAEEDIDERRRSRRLEEKSRVVDFLRDKSDIEVHELFSESMFDPIYRAYAEAVATVPNRTRTAEFTRDAEGVVGTDIRQSSRGGFVRIGGV